MSDFRKIDTKRHWSKRVHTIVQETLDELAIAMRKFPQFNSGHEGYAVILEELDELWEEVRSKNGTKESQYNEAKQVAAMALRFMHDVCTDFENDQEFRFPD